MDKKSFSRITAALIVSAATIFLLSVIKSGPTSAPDFECVSTGTSQTSKIDISSGETGSEIARELFEKGVVKSWESFFRVAVSDPRSSSIAPGLHIVDQRICAQDALLQLLDSKRIAGLIAFPEGAWNREIKEIFIKSGYKKKDIERAFETVNPPAPFKSLEGLLFPAQYSFAQGTSASDALEAIVENGVNQLTTLGIVNGKGNFTPHELLTIASIIQAEGDEKDFTKVARVIYNRLDIDMPLQMDSTV
ncbi:MAG: endolytic transglycosylase MltG, partial [Candidatus Planktophila sp.]